MKVPIDMVAELLCARGVNCKASYQPGDSFKHIDIEVSSGETIQVYTANGEDDPEDEDGAIILLTDDMTMKDKVGNDPCWTYTSLQDLIDDVLNAVKAHLYTPHMMKTKRVM